MSHRAGNKQCMTCVGHGGRAPQYVCVAFGTFLCTACAGVHRDFQFRVKSISSSKFSKEEVQLANEEGNDAARAKFLAGWYGTENERSCPMVENTKTAALKNFIRQVFVERRLRERDPRPRSRHPRSRRRRRRRRRSCNNTRLQTSAWRRLDSSSSSPSSLSRLRRRRPRPRRRTPSGSADSSAPLRRTRSRSSRRRSRRRPRLPRRR